jgi:hypothetical protein
MKEELPSDMRQKLAEYRKQVEAAYESEFKLEDSKLVGARTVTRDQLADLAATAVATLREVMEESDSDAVRVKVATFVLDKVLGKDTVLDPDDPMKDVVKRLTAVDD